MKRTIQIILILIVVGGLSLVIWNNTAGGSVTTADPKVIAADDWIIGDKNASVTIIEYADFQCPACKIYSGWLTQLEQDYSGKLRIVYRYFPLPSHPHSRISAAYAEAAGKQGKFVEMHDLLFNGQDDWAEKTDTEAQKIFQGYATQLALNLDQLKIDVASSTTKDRVEHDYQLGQKAGVNATPTLYINGTKMESLGSYDVLKKVVAAYVEGTVK